MLCSLVRLDAGLSVMQIFATTSLPEGVDELLTSSRTEGFRMVQRLVEDWSSGANRFDRTNETLLCSNAGGQLAATCGLNVDPYANDAAVGRVRHLYVLPSLRQRGIGRALVQSIVTHAAGRFDALRVRTDSAHASQFYERLGFRAVACPDASHMLTL